MGDPGGGPALACALVLATATSVASSSRAAPAAALRPSDGGGVVVSAVFADGYAPGEGDEAIQLWNAGEEDVALDAWSVADDAGRASFPAGARLGAGAWIWLTEDAEAFRRSFGREADWAWEGQAGPGRLATVGGGPSLANDGDAVALRDGRGRLVDAVAYGDSGGTEGWSGPPVVPYRRPSIGVANQVLYRKIDPSSRRPVDDANGATDWASDRADAVLGRRARRPGWDLEERLRPEALRDEGSIEVAVAPDALHGFLRRHLGSATRSLDIEVYSFEHAGLADVVAARAAAGVRVRLLVDGSPVGGMSLEERWCLAAVAGAGGQVFLHDDGGDVGARYRSAHAKVIVVDDHLALVGSENLGPGAAPDDDFADGTSGRRGVYVATDAPGVVAWARDLVARDIDPESHVDARPFQPRDPRRGAPPEGFEPVDGPRVGYRPRFVEPLRASGVHDFELLAAPESALDPQAGLLGLLARAGPGAEVLGEQLSEPPWWGEASEGDVARNPRLLALLTAARRGARVRLLLDGWFDDPGDANGNVSAAAWLGAAARAEGLDLDVRRGNPAAGGLHNKMYLVSLPDGRRWAHVGSLNGTEVSSKVNREAAVQVESPAVHAYLAAVFEHDWATTNALYLPALEMARR